MSVPVVEAATSADAPAIAELFADVFSGDPVWSALVPQSSARHKVVLASFRQALRNRGHEHFDVIRGEGGEILGALNYEGPQQENMSPLVVRVANGALRTFSPTARRIARHDEAVHAHRPEVPHWYLKDLVTSPSARGQGLGSALLESRLRAVDADALPAFLESTSEASRRLYERFGFEHVATVEVVPQARSFIMVRRPRSASL